MTRVIEQEHTLGSVLEDTNRIKGLFRIGGEDSEVNLTKMALALGATYTIVASELLAQGGEGTKPGETPEEHFLESAYAGQDLITRAIDAKAISKFETSAPLEEADDGSPAPS